MSNRNLTQSNLRVWNEDNFFVLTKIQEEILKERFLKSTKKLKYLGAILEHTDQIELDVNQQNNGNNKIV